MNDSLKLRENICTAFFGKFFEAIAFFLGKVSSDKAIAPNWLSLQLAIIVKHE
jgi:hypothetical protein